MRTLHCFVVLVSLCLAACSPKVTDASAEPEKAAEEAIEKISESKDIAIKGGENVAFVVASIKKTPCFGRCPVYEATLYSDNRIVYNGKSYTEKEGLHEASITDEQLKELLRAALAADYFQLAETYPIEGRPIPDLPNTITYLKIGERENEVRNNHDAPQLLRDYEQAFVQLLKTLKWEAVEGK